LLTALIFYPIHTAAGKTAVQLTLFYIYFARGRLNALTALLTNPIPMRPQQWQARKRRNGRLRAFCYAYVGRGLVRAFPDFQGLFVLRDQLKVRGKSSEGRAPIICTHEAILRAD